MLKDGRIIYFYLFHRRTKKFRIEAADESDYVSFVARLVITLELVQHLYVHNLLVYLMPL
jgi:hypothetical protein